MIAQPRNLSGPQQTVALAVDQMAYKGTQMAAAKGVPWAAVVVLVKEILVAVVGTIAGGKSGCVAEAFSGPTFLSLFIGATVSDYANAWFCTSGTPGDSSWSAIKPSLQACGYPQTSIYEAERKTYNFFAGQSLCKHVNNRSRAKAKAANNKYIAAKKAAAAAKAQAASAKKQAEIEAGYGKTKKKGDNTYLYLGAGALLLFALTGKKKKRSA